MSNDRIEDSTTGRPVKRPSGSSARRSMRRRLTTQQELAAANRASRLKSADCIRRRAGLDEVKAELAERLGEFGRRMSAQLDLVADAELSAMVRDNPKAFITGLAIIYDKLDRATARPLPPAMVNIDLGKIRELLRVQREDARRIMELEGLAKAAEVSSAVQTESAETAPEKHEQDAGDSGRIAVN